MRRKRIQSMLSHVGIVQSAEQLEDRTLLSTFYVNSSFANLNVGQDPDGAGPAQKLGQDSFASIQAAIDAASHGDTILISNGTYSESLTISKNLNLYGNGAAGVLLTPSTGAGITITGQASMVNIANLTVDTATADAIRIAVGSGANTTVSLTNIDARNSGGDGLNISASASGRLGLSLSNVLFDSAAGDAIDISSTGGARVNVTGSGLSGGFAGADGLHLYADGGTLTFDVDNVGSFANAGDDGIDAVIKNSSSASFSLRLSAATGKFADFTGATDNGAVLSFSNYKGYSSTLTTFDFNNVDFSRSGRAGFVITSSGVSPGAESTFNGVVTNGRINQAGGHAFQATLSGNNPKSAIRFVDTTFTNAAGDAVNIVTSNATLFDVDIIDCNLTGSAGQNVSIKQDQGSKVDIFIDPTQLDKGFRFSGENGTHLTAEVLDTPLSRGDLKSNYGVFGVLTTGATMDLIVRNSYTDQAIYDGINVTASGGSRFNATFINSAITNSGRYGMFLNLDNSNATVSFVNSKITNSVLGHNVYVVAKNASVAQLTFDSASSDLTGAAVNALHLEAHGANSSVTVGLGANANLSNAGRDGISLVATAGGRTTVNAANGLTINNAGRFGIYEELTGGSATVTASNVIISSASNGVFLKGSASAQAAVTLTNVTSITSTTANSVSVNIDNSNALVGLSGKSGTPMALNATKSSGVDVKATSNSSLTLGIDNFVIANAWANGIRFNLDNSRIISSTISNGAIRNSGQSGSLAAGILIHAVNNAVVGTPGLNDIGLTLTNVTLENSVGSNVQDHGLQVTADSGAKVRAKMTGGAILRNANHGLIASANPDNSNNDAAQISLDLNGVNITSNKGDGVNLTALRGNNVVNQPLTSGITFSYANGTISQNGNGVINDGFGDGIDATANGNGLTAANTTVALVLVNANITNNEEQQIRATALNGGLVSQSFTGGSVISPGTAGILISADGPISSAEASYNNVKINGLAGGAGIILSATNGGFASGTFQNLTGANAISGFGAQGLLFQALTGGTVRGTLNNVQFLNNMSNSALVVEPITGQPVQAAIQGVVTGVGSSAKVDFTNVLVQNNNSSPAKASQLGAFDVNVIGGGKFESVIKGLTLTNNAVVAGQGAFDVRVAGANSVVNLDIDKLYANSSSGRGVHIAGSDNAVLNITRFDNVYAQDANEIGFNLVLGAGARLGAPLNMVNNSFIGAKTGDGINIDITDATTDVTLNMNTVLANNAKGIGIDINIAGSGNRNLDLKTIYGTGAQTGNGLDLTISGLISGNTANVAIGGTSSFLGANQTGVNITLAGAVGSTGVVAISNTTASNAANGAGVNLGFSGGIDMTSVILVGVTANNAKTHGLNISKSGANTTKLRLVSVSNSSFSGAQTGHGVAITMDAQNVLTNLTLRDVTANNAHLKGVAISAAGLTGAGGNTIALWHVVANNALDDGVEVDASGIGASSRLDVILYNSANGNSSFNSAGKDAIDLRIDGVAGSTARVIANGISATNAAQRAFNVTMTGSISTAVTNLNSITANNAGYAGLVLNAAGGAILTEVNSSNANFSSAGAALQNANARAVYINVDSQTVPINVTFAGLNVSNSYADALSILLDGVRKASNITLSNVNGQNSQTGRGLNVQATGMNVSSDKAVVTVTNSNFSGAALDAAAIRFGGTAVATGAVNLSGLTLNNAGNDGLDLSMDGGLNVWVLGFSGITAQSNKQNGLKFSVTGGANLTNLTASNMNLSNNGISGDGFDGIDVRVSGASSRATFNLSNLTINNSGGRAIDLDVYSDGALTFNLTIATIDRSVFQGIDVNVGSFDEVGTSPTLMGSGSFTGNFKDVTLTNNGQAATITSDGFNMHVTGVGSFVNLTLDDVISNFNSEDGFDIDILNGTANVSVLNGSVGSNNGKVGVSSAGLGFDFFVSGLTTVASLSMGGTSTNLFNNNLGGPGLRVSVLNQAMMTQLGVNASASGNAGDGIQILANDASGVVINNFLLTSSSVVVNGNQGNGLQVDLDSVIGITSFNLSGMTVSNNVGDQINIRFANMSALTSVNFNNVTVTGPGIGSGLGDGLEFTLDNTTITDSLGLSSITASQNGGHGLYLKLLNGAVIPSSQIDLGKFDNNGGHGVNLTLSGATAAISIVNSQAQFGYVSSMSGNREYGINIDLENGSRLTGDITRQLINNNGGGIRVNSSGNSKYNVNAAGTAASGNGITFNTITNNQGFGFRGIFLGGVFDLALGSQTIVGQGNTISGNRDAGIGIDMIQDAVGRIGLFDNVITSTGLGTATGFAGEAIKVRMLGTNNVTPASNLLDYHFGAAVGDGIYNVTPGLWIARNKIGVTSANAAAGNAGSGIGFDVQERSVIDGLHILNNTIAHSRNDAGIAGEGDGIRFTRRDEVLVNDFFIDENVIEFNTDDGIEIVAQNTSASGTVPMIMTMIIGMDGQRNGTTVVGTDTVSKSSIANWLNALDGNIIRNNGDDGIALQVNADAGLVVNMTENRIQSNGGDGVQLTEITQSGGDLRRISGYWTQNIMANNSGFGVNSRALLNNGFNSPTSLHVTDGFIGAVLDQFGNVQINGNGLSGALVMGYGNSTWDNVDVLMNGRLAASAIDGHGFDIEGVASYVAIRNSTIRQNAHDGIEIQAGGDGTHGLTTNGFTLRVDLADNRVVQNTGRGLDILNTMSSSLTVNVTGSIDPRNGTISPPSQYSSNGEEGIYVVQSSDGKQGQSELSSVLLLSGGAVNRIPHLILNIDQTDVSNNGNTVLAQTPDNLGSSGVVVRVGTSGGNYDLQGSGLTSQAGGFASDVSVGIVMAFTSNRLHGNFGDDVFFHSFVSTGNAAGIGGSWSGTEYNPSNTGRGDPLARLDLTWGVKGQVNEFDTLRLWNNVSGQFGTNTGDDLQPGAFYDNADSTYKSRTRQTGADAPNGGPFQNDNRRRNATRLALRNYADYMTSAPSLNYNTLGPTATPNPNSSPNPFLFQGMGESTFRVQASNGNNYNLVGLESAGVPVAPGTPFNGFESFYLDDDPRSGGDFLIDNLGDLWGVGIVAPSNGFGETPWGWNGGYNWPL
ncbi:beta strand repeat-containing protein [Planctomicrobium sp. SH664]|uniref:beta strand repeat-containing protein n=1 Tax=Planctomicrobium sp. SH664 TaxID=3448125 RepID=UPI003F5B3CDA